MLGTHISVPMHSLLFFPLMHTEEAISLPSVGWISCTSDVRKDCILVFILTDRIVPGWERTWLRVKSSMPCLWAFWKHPVDHLCGTFIGWIFHCDATVPPHLLFVFVCVSQTGTSHSKAPVPAYLLQELQVELCYAEFATLESIANPNSTWLGDSGNEAPPGSLKPSEQLILVIRKQPTITRGPDWGKLGFHCMVYWLHGGLKLHRMNAWRLG